MARCAGLRSESRATISAMWNSVVKALPVRLSRISTPDIATLAAYSRRT